MIPRDDNLAKTWLASARDPAIVALLESIYADLATEVTRRGPSCWASGRCCNFEKAGHRLYVTGLEAAYAFAHLDHSHPPLTPSTLTDARNRGGCPFQTHNLCGIHAIKPMGCRVYFCDRSAQTCQQDLSEKMLERIKRLHETHAIPYRYGEWRDMLGLFATQ